MRVDWRVGRLVCPMAVSSAALKAATKVAKKVDMTAVTLVGK